MSARNFQISTDSFSRGLFKESVWYTDVLSDSRWYCENVIDSNSVGGVMGYTTVSSRIPKLLPQHSAAISEHNYSRYFKPWGRFHKDILVKSLGKEENKEFVHPVYQKKLGGKDLKSYPPCWWNKHLIGISCIYTVFLNWSMDHSISLTSKIISINRHLVWS